MKYQVWTKEIYFFLRNIRSEKRDIFLCLRLTSKDFRRQNICWRQKAFDVKQIAEAKKYIDVKKLLTPKKLLTSKNVWRQTMLRRQKSLTSKTFWRQNAFDVKTCMTSNLFFQCQRCTRSMAQTITKTCWRSPAKWRQRVAWPSPRPWLWKMGFWARNDVAWIWLCMWLGIWISNIE